MGRYKGQRSAATIDREYPHQVCLDVPHLGFGKSLDVMMGYCRDRDFAQRPGDDRLVHQALWCFKTVAAADAFHERFSSHWHGKRVDR